MSSPKTRSGATASRPGAAARAAAIVSGSTSKPSSAPSRATRRVRSGSAVNARGETIRRRPARRSSIPPNGSTASPPASGSAIALTVRSRWRQVRLDRLPGQRQQVQLPAVIAGHHPPGAEPLREGKGMPSGRPRQCARQGLGIALYGDVEIAAAPAQQPVPYRSPDQPGAGRRQPGKDLQRLAHAGSPSRW